MRGLPTTRALLRFRAGLGVAGLALTVPAIAVIVSLGSAGPLDPIGSSTRAVSRGLDQLGVALERVERSISSAGTTLDDARDSAGSAAAMTDALGSAMADLSSASGVDVLGVRPLAGLAPRFSEIATRAGAVAQSLRATASSLGTTKAELLALSGEVAALSVTARRLGAGQAGDALGGTSMLAARVLLALLLAWMAVTAALSAYEAFRALRRAGLADPG